MIPQHEVQDLFMSEHAKSAYAQGEMPASRWSQLFAINLNQVRSLMLYTGMYSTSKYGHFTAFFRMPFLDNATEVAKFRRRASYIRKSKRKFWSYYYEYFKSE